MNDYKQSIIETCVTLHQQKMLAAADGNVSYRVSDDEIIITPAGRSKRALTVEDFAAIDVNNQVLVGKPSSEMKMHTTVFKACQSAKVVIHAHPPTAIAWTIAKPELTELPAECFSELILATGGIPIASFARPGTQDVGDVLIPYLPDYKAIILARHGAITWGETFEEALNGMERIEHAADILMRASTIGKLTALPEEEVKALFALRRTIGNKLL